MRANRLIPIAGLAFAVACSDTATSPTLTSVGGPLFAVTAGTYPAGGVTTLNAGGTPSGGHIQTGGPVNCIVEIDLDVSCSGNGDYEISGLGNTNGTATLSVAYSATVNCTNRGGNLVEVKSHVTDAGASTGNLRTKNGRLTVPVLSSSTPTDEEFEDQADCPNGNWTPTVAPGDPTLESFEYDLTFAGFATPAIFISAQ
jgi:putative hemolysin